MSIQWDGEKIPLLKHHMQGWISLFLWQPWNINRDNCMCAFIEAWLLMELQYIIYWIHRLKIFKLLHVFTPLGQSWFYFVVMFHSLSNLCLLWFLDLPLNTEIHLNYPWYLHSLSCMVLDIPYFMGVDSSYFLSGNYPSGLSQLTDCWDTDSQPFLSCLHS